MADTTSTVLRQQARATANCTNKREMPKGRVDCVWEIKQGDALSVLKTMPEQSVHCCVTSPPYWGLRDYGVDGQLGLESTPDEYVEKMVEVFREVRRVLRDDGTLWLNLGDSYAGSGKGAWDNKEVQKEVYVPDKDSPQCKLKKVPQGLKPKDLVGIPWMVAFALRADGWYLRSDIIWHKPNAMPESVKDRPTKAHEYIFLLSKSPKYYYDYEAIKEQAATEGRIKKCGPGSHAGTDRIPCKQKKQDLVGNRQYTGFNERWRNRPVKGRNKRTVWTVATYPFPEAHFATFPPKLIEPCILAGCPVGGTVLDPFAGSGTTLLVATQHHRKSIGIAVTVTVVYEIAKRLG
jgi:DNA modification methylase